MKSKIFFGVFILICCIFVFNCSGQKKLFVRVENPYDIERKSETVVLKWKELKQKAPWLDKSKVTVFDSVLNSENLCQTVEDDLLFQSDFMAYRAKTFILSNLVIKKWLV